MNREAVTVVPDLVLHVHDRVLIYGSEGEESEMESP